MAYKDPEKAKEYQRKYQKDNPERINKINKKWRKKNPEKVREIGKKWRENNSEKTKEYRRTHREKILKKKGEYRQNNREDLNKKAKEYYQKNKKKINKKNRISRQKNPEKTKEKNRKYQKKRRKTDPRFRLRRNISSALFTALKERGMSKQGKSTFNLIGYTKEQLIKHLESLFTEGMTLENYGEWVIDHVIPDSFFNYNDIVEFRICWSLENLQPMWKKDNLEKSDKIILWGKEIRAKNLDRDYFSKITYEKDS